MKSWPSLASFGKILSLPGGELFYYDSADNNSTDKPAIILIHGLGDEADSWRHIFPLLAGAGYRVIAPDLPGFGRSLWKGKISVRGHRNAVIRLMARSGAAGAGRPVVLAGSSLGAGIAEMAACKRPNLVKALILIDGCFPFEYKLDKGFFLQALLALPFVGKKWYRTFRLNHEAAWRSLYPYYADLNGMKTEDKDFLRERVIARVESSNQERGYFATLRSMNNLFAFGRQNSARMIKAWPGKIAVIWGEQDRVVPVKKNAPFRSLRPDADFALIAGAGHLPHQEKPAETAAEMLRFLQKLSTSSHSR
ncbi:MAG: alpha/beta hydrolase [Treponema sp.]|jgi:pimeloyl-ACP methyl ester carboxylesterase|nr:alpha/beta hydrolase [Treponema sp.]